MITRKAAIGFIILAIIVFPTASFSWVSPIPQTTPEVSGAGFTVLEPTVGAREETSVYKPPMIEFGNPFDMAIAVTVIIEVFTLICYLVLKRIEPYIISWEESERERIRNNQ